MLEVAYPRVRNQRFAAAAQELIQQRQVGAVVEHVGDDDQVVAISLGKEIRRIAQLHTIQFRIGAAGR